MRSRSSTSYVAAYKSVFAFFLARGHPITNLATDNESSTDLTLFLHTLVPRPYVQFVPSHNHRANVAERHIRTFKNHFIAILSSVHIHFPLSEWDRLLPLRPLRG